MRSIFIYITCLCRALENDPLAFKVPLSRLEPLEVQVPQLMAPVRLRHGALGIKTHPPNLLAAIGQVLESGLEVLCFRILEQVLKHLHRLIPSFLVARITTQLGLGIHIYIYIYM